jgi:mannose/cellobiose epimerase-like protein (N-acyl-D-glucosamine 2-epimerase family)
MTRVNLGAGSLVKVVRKKKGGVICPEGKAWAKRTFDTYPSAYANLAASKYCKDPNYAKKSKRKGK